MTTNNEADATREEQVWEAYLQFRKDTAKGLRGMADTYAQLVEMGSSKVRLVPPKEADLLMRIHDGTLLPEVMLEIPPMLQSRVKFMRVEDQRRVLSGERVKVLTFDPATDRHDVLEVDPRDLSSKQVQLVYERDGRKRDVHEQRQYLEELRLKEFTKRRAKPEVEGPTVDKRKKLVHANGKETWTLDELLRFAQMLSS